MALDRLNEELQRREREILDTKRNHKEMEKMAAERAVRRGRKGYLGNTSE